jgi:hypothetical protein
MNTSTNTTQRITARTTLVGFRRRTLAGALLAMTIAGTAVGLAATSHADFGDPAPDYAHSTRPGANCKTEPWGFLGSQRRTLCDTPVAGDGSWSRERTIWTPAHMTSSYCYGGSSDRFYGSGICTGGYFVDQKLISNETYPVRPDTVLPDEPGHLD